MNPYYYTTNGRLYHAEVMEGLKEIWDETIQCVVTSPPYWGIRNYEVDGQIGLEDKVSEYIHKLTKVFRVVRRKLRPDGVMWMNMGDAYIGFWGNYGPTSFGGQRPKYNERWTRGAYRKHKDWRPPTSQKQDGLKNKDMAGLPWRLAFSLQEDGWYLRSDVIWKKPNAMPESVTDRPSKNHEYVFLLSKSERYLYDREDMGSNRRHKRTVWTISNTPSRREHYAAFPENLAATCIMLGSKMGEIVLDPFMGSGTVGVVCERLGRRWLGIDISQQYCAMAAERIERGGTVQVQLRGGSG